MNIICVIGFFPEKDGDNIPNFGARRVTNNLLLNIQQSSRIDKIIYFIADNDHEKLQTRQDSRIELFPISQLKTKLEELEEHIRAVYCIRRQVMKLLENFKFKKIFLIHSQDGPDLLEEYGRYVFECNKNNCFWISPSKAGKRIALRIFKEFEKHKKGGYDHRIEVIPWGISSINLQPKQIRKGHIKLLYFGRINSQYKADLLPLFDMVKKLRKEYGGLKLHLAGNITDAEYDRLSPFFDQNIIYHGEISEVKKMEFIRSHDILISPANSTQETFGVTLIEAASQGLLCIGSDWNGYNEILQKHCLINVKTTIPDVDIPVGKKYLKKLHSLNKKISSHISIDWKNCEDKVRQAIQDLEHCKRKDCLCANIDTYLWSAIIKKHEEIWFGEDNISKDKTLPLPEGLAIPARLFFDI